MQTKPKLFIPVGVPGCGKTTFYKENFNNTNMRYVSRDEIRMSLIHDNDEYFKYEKEVFRRYVFEIANYLKNGKNVYADATQLNHPSRAKLVNALTRMGLTWDKYDIVFIYFYTALETCLERNQYRSGRACIPEDAVRDMYKNMTEPSSDEFLNVVDKWRVGI